MQGLRLANDTNIQSLIVVGDSKIVIGKMVLKNNVVDNILDSMLDRAKKEVLTFSNIKLFHVLWENNQIVDVFDYNDTLLKERVIRINENKHNFPIP
jgi:hypothetical protein